MGAFIQVAPPVYYADSDSQPRAPYLDVSLRHYITVKYIPARDHVFRGFTCRIGPPTSRDCCKLGTPYDTSMLGASVKAMACLGRFPGAPPISLWQEHHLFSIMGLSKRAMSFAPPCSASGWTMQIAHSRVSFDGRPSWMAAVDALLTVMASIAIGPSRTAHATVFIQPGQLCPVPGWSFPVLGSLFAAPMFPRPRQGAPPSPPLIEQSMEDGTEQLRLAMDEEAEQMDELLE